MNCCIHRRLRFSSSRLFLSGTTIRIEGESPYGLRRYLLQRKATDEDTDELPPLSILASLIAHRNVVFGAKVYVKDQSISNLCDSLLKRALEDCTSVGEQPQALSTLHGLTVYVQSCLEDQEESLVLNEIRGNDKEYEAVRAIATGVPRPGHSVVGPGTHRDAGTAWERLAKEFIQKSRADECLLYQKLGGELVGIELLADTKPDYLKSAGGAMARFFFA